MEILIGTSLLIAILLLGALLSAANERQRAALDGIREQVEAWAQEDILIKRENIARSVSLESPMEWLERIAAGALGLAPGILSTSVWEKDELVALIALCKDGGRLVFTPTPRERFLKTVRLKKRGALTQADSGLLGDKPEKVAHYDLSVVTSGMFFDIEAARVWPLFSGKKLPAKRLTMFEIPPRSGTK